MRAAFARPAFALAVAAMLLRALLPVGWMPANAGPTHAFITICTMEGPVHVAMPGADKPAPDPRAHDRANAPCAFAAAAAFAPLTQLPAFAIPLAFAHFVGTTVAATNRSHERDSAHAPRAPPHSLA